LWKKTPPPKLSYHGGARMAAITDIIVLKPVIKVINFRCNVAGETLCLLGWPPPGRGLFISRYKPHRMIAARQICAGGGQTNVILR
jgi:hypothetical protein